MLKKLRKATSLILTIVLTLLVFTPTAVRAVVPGEDSFPGSNSGQSQEAIRSIYGSQASVGLRNSLLEYNVVVKDTTLIEVIPFGMQAGTTALLITDSEGTTVNKSLLFALNSDGTVQSVSEPNSGEMSLCKVVGDREDPFYDESFVGSWAIEYNRYIIDSMVCVQPVYAMIICYNEGGYNLELFSMQYSAIGMEYTYPEGVILSYDLVEHLMEITPENPRANRYYSNSNAYRTDRALCVEMPGGQIVYFTFKINGRYYYGDVYIPNY